LKPKEGDLSEVRLGRTGEATAREAAAVWVWSRERTGAKLATFRFLTSSATGKVGAY
jgi:hypothetical protein